MLYAGNGVTKSPGTIVTGLAPTQKPQERAKHHIPRLSDKDSMQKNYITLHKVIFSFPGQEIYHISTIPVRKQLYPYSRILTVDSIFDFFFNRKKTNCLNEQLSGILLKRRI